MMPPNSNSYLETQVLTSPPQKLQLILIEAAIRFSKKAEALREQGEEAAACEAIGRAQKIVSEIIGGLNQEIDPELIGQIASIYIFISQSLSAANLPENAQQLTDAIRVLEEERTTWRLVCEKISAEGAQHNEAAVLHQQNTQGETLDAVAVNATAGNATAPEENLMPMPPSTYSPAPIFNPAGGSTIAEVSGPSKLSGPTKLPNESAAEQPTGGFSIDA